MSEKRDIQEILEVQQAMLDTLQKALENNHYAWKTERENNIRLESHLDAALSLLSELAVHSGVSEAHFAACFRERFLIFLDRQLTEGEKVSPSLAAQFDNRDEGEIPTSQNFRRLFPDEAEGE